MVLHTTLMCLLTGIYHQWDFQQSQPKKLPNITARQLLLDEVWGPSVSVIRYYTIVKLEAESDHGVCWGFFTSVSCFHRRCVMSPAAMTGPGVFLLEANELHNVKRLVLVVDLQILARSVYSLGLPCACSETSESVATVVSLKMNTGFGPCMSCTLSHEPILKLPLLLTWNGTALRNHHQKALSTHKASIQHLNGTPRSV